MSVKCGSVARRFSFLFVFAAFFTYFIWAAITPDLPSEDRPVVFYSNQLRQDFRYTLKEALKKAHRSIHITMYGFTDPAFAALLQKKAEEGVDVKVFFDARGSDSILVPPVQAFPLRGKGLKHRKIVVIDEELLFLGSANMTPSSLTAHDNLSVGLFYPALARNLTGPQLSPYRFEQGELWLLPHPEALKCLISLLQSTKNKIFVSMFTLTHPLLIQELIEAHKRGVDVQVAVDYFAGRGAGAKALKALAGGGVKILISQGQQLLHHKWMVADNRLIMGSVNWTKAGFSANQDFFIIFESLTSDQRKYFDKLCHIIDLESNNMID